MKLQVYHVNSNCEIEPYSLIIQLHSVVKGYYAPEIIASFIKAILFQCGYN